MSDQIEPLKVTVCANHSALPIEYRADGFLYPSGIVFVTSRFMDGDTAFEPDFDAGITLNATHVILPDGKQIDVVETKAGLYVERLASKRDHVAFDHGGITIANPFHSECGRFQVSPETYGFSVWDTGGGCKAYGKKVEDGRYILLTNLEGDDLPSGENDALIGLYDANGQEISMNKIPSLDDLENDLADPDDEHRKAYPDQYSHHLCGKKVKVMRQDIEGTVYRVVPSRFGPLAILKEHGSETSWSIQHLVEIK